MPTKEEAYNQLELLVNRFTENFDSYKSIDYNELQTRRDFIEPFFKALGWDIDNSQGFAEAYREVILEDKVKIEKATKVPDYSFRLSGGKRLFFVEAKKPSILVKDDISVAYQVRRYGWSAKLSISIVTDFEEFAVYDCTKKPNPKDKSSIARIKYLTFDKYLTEFDFLWNIFSKEQVLKGKFDRYIQSDTVKKGTATVDKEFLASLDTWRTYLATSISIKNKELDEDEISFAVQQTIDRLIFLRIAEDRGVEPYGQLKSSVNQKGDAYENLFYNFKKADEKYNSGLFDFKKDVISDKLKIDSKVVKTIVNEMYFPESPYEFSVISVEILGSAYEQFLGKQIIVETGHRAKIEEKPEVRKAGGVYYTPQYVVEYIVKNTIGKLVEGKSPKQIEKIKICDPACGSGSFLIGAYQYLLDYHKNYYTDNGTKKGKKDSPITPEGNLTSAEKKKILLNNIYGVDIDANAVEVTKLSLLLKCMEGETETTIAQQFKLWHERILPTLDNNIKSGNSLIGTNFYDSVIDFGEDKKIKPFNWQKAFPDVFIREASEPKEDLRQIAKKAKEHAKKAMEYALELEEKLNVSDSKNNYPSKFNGGFDIIIGNPPYVQLREEQFLGSEKRYYYDQFKTSEYQLNTFGLFIEKGVNLIKQDGFLGFIIPNYWLSTKHDKKLRKFVFQTNHVKEIINVYKVFETAVVDTLILIMKRGSNEYQNTTAIKSIDRNLKTVDKRLSILKQEIWHFNKEIKININDDDISISFQDSINIKSDYTIKDYFTLKFGAKLYEKGKGNPIQDDSFSKYAVYEADNKKDDTYKKLLRAKHIKHYRIVWENNWVKYGANLAAPRSIDIFQGNRILVQRIVSKNVLEAVYTFDDFICNTDVITLKPINSDIDCRFFLGIINSELCAKYIKSLNVNLDRNVFPKINTNTLETFPVPNLKNVKKESFENIVNAVELVMSLYKELSNTKLSDKIEQLKSRIEHTDKKLNRLVYELYGLSDENT